MALTDMRAMREAARVTDPVLNKAFQDEFAAAQGKVDVLNTEDWRYVVGFFFEETCLRVKDFAPSGWDDLMRQLTDHLSQGPGTEIGIMCVPSAEVPRLLEMGAKMLVSDG